MLLHEKFGLNTEAFEKCSILFKFKSKIPDYERGKAKILTAPYDLPDLRGRHEYMDYFEDKAKASLRAKC